MVRKECDEGQRCRILKSDYLGGGRGEVKVKDLCERF